MIEVNRKVRFLTALIILALFIAPVIAVGSNGFSSAQRDRVEGMLTEKYAELPGIEFEFGEPVATFGSMTFRPYSNLALSVPNLADGLVVGVATYGEVNYLLMAVELPQDMGPDYGAGLINLSTEQAVFAAVVELSDQKGNVDELGFDLSSPGGDSPDLNLTVNGRKYVLETVIPKSL